MERDKCGSRLAGSACTSRLFFIILFSNWMHHCLAMATATTGNEIPPPSKLFRPKACLADDGYSYNGRWNSTSFQACTVILLPSLSPKARNVPSVFCVLKDADSMVSSSSQLTVLYFTLPCTVFVHASERKATFISSSIFYIRNKHPATGVIITSFSKALEFSCFLFVFKTRPKSFHHCSYQRKAWSRCCEIVEPFACTDQSIHMVTVVVSN